MDTNLEKTKNKIRNLPQNKNLTDEELTKVARATIEKQAILDNLTFCVEDEKEYAANLLEQYLAESSLTSIADRGTLAQLIDNSVLIRRIKMQMKKEYEKANPDVPLKMSEELRNLIEQDYMLKERLGLTKQGNQSILDAWEELKEKALKYYEEHAGCNICRCPECKKMFMIMKDMTGHYTEKLKIFNKTILYNRPLYELYDKKVITLEKMAEIFGVTTEQIIYTYEKVYKNDRNDNLKQESKDV